MALLRSLRLQGAQSPTKKKIAVMRCGAGENVRGDLLLQNDLQATTESIFAVPAKSLESFRVCLGLICGQMV